MDMNLCISVILDVFARYPPYSLPVLSSVKFKVKYLTTADPEGGGTGGLDPPGKSQVIWVSIGNKQLDLPWKKLDPPPWKKLDPLENVGPPLEP